MGAETPNPLITTFWRKIITFYNCSLTQEYLKEILSYNPETGIFTWIVNKSPGARMGGEAGCINCRSKYITIQIDGRPYQAHRLAWLYVHGEFPAEQIDHINHVRGDNRIINLREATPLDNQRNRTLGRNNTSGIIGVYYVPLRNKWIAHIRINRKRIFLGEFKDKSKAALARQKAEKEIGFHDNHGKA